MTPPPPPKPRNLLQRTLTIAAVGMSLGIGTCGFVILSQSHDSTFTRVLALAGTAVFLVSLFVIVITLLLLVIRHIRDATSTRRSK